MEDDTFKRILQDITVHLQIKAEQKEIIQNVLERKDSMAECYQRASERACVTSPLFGQAERQSHLRRYESTSIISMVNQMKERKIKINFGGKTKEKEDEEEVIIDNTDETIISKGMFPTKESMDILVDGIPFKDIPIVHIKATGNNTIIIATDKDRVLASASGGTVGFKNAKKGSNVAAQTAAMDVAQKTLFKDVKTVRVCVRGIGPGRLPAIKALESGGLNVISITDATRFAFNGNRPKKQRRL